MVRHTAGDSFGTSWLKCDKQVYERMVDSLVLPPNTSSDDNDMFDGTVQAAPQELVLPPPHQWQLPPPAHSSTGDVLCIQVNARRRALKKRSSKSLSFASSPKRTRKMQTGHHLSDVLAIRGEPDLPTSIKTLVEQLKASSNQCSIPQTDFVEALQ